MEEILVTDWEKVDADDFYLSDKWADSIGDVEIVDMARRLQKESKLYIAYRVPAKNYAIYRQMDAFQVFIDGDCNIVLDCESAIIGNHHAHRVEVEI